MHKVTLLFRGIIEILITENRNFSQEVIYLKQFKYMSEIQPLCRKKLGFYGEARFDNII